MSRAGSRHNPGVGCGDGPGGSRTVGASVHGPPPPSPTPPPAGQRHGGFGWKATPPLPPLGRAVIPGRPGMKNAPLVKRRLLDHYVKVACQHHSITAAQTTANHSTPPISVHFQYHPTKPVLLPSPHVTPLPPLFSLVVSADLCNWKP